MRARSRRRKIKPLSHDHPIFHGGASFVFRDEIPEDDADEADDVAKRMRTDEAAVANTFGNRGGSAEALRFGEAANRLPGEADGLHNATRRRAVAENDCRDYKAGRRRVAPAL